MESCEELEELVRQYSGLVFTICYSMTGDYFVAEDLAQDTFVAACRGFQRFDGENAKAWLARIASTRCKDYLKSAARRTQAAPDELFQELPDRGDGPEEELLSADVERRMETLCGELKEPYGSVAKAHFLEQHTAGEIAERTGKSVKTVQTQIYRARGMLRKRWKEVLG